MPPLPRFSIVVEPPVRFALLALALAFVSCQDERSVTGARHAPRLAASAQTPTAVIGPSGDTFLNLDGVSYATNTLLAVYTWPNDTIANAIVMKFDLASVPTGSTVSSATLSLYLTESDATADPTYTVTAHKIITRNADPARATGYTSDGVNAWTANACCRNHVPLAQADIGAAVDTRSIDKTPGFKQWDVTSIVQGWLDAPAANFGLLLNSDPSKLRDRYRYFSSSEDPVASHRPYLTVTYSASDTAPNPAPGPEAQVGQWSAVFPAPIVQVHVHLLTDGTVLSWGRIGDPQVWDPATGAFTAVPAPSWLFCAGHDFLPDGRLLVAGGHIADGVGPPDTNLFDPTTHTWQVPPPLAQGRLDPTSTPLPDYDAATIAVTDQHMPDAKSPGIPGGTFQSQPGTSDLGV